MQTTLADWIKGDLAGRIGSGAGPPAPLTLPALARHYGVSPTPVRVAIRGLVAEGLLLKEGNGRLRLNPRPVRRRAIQPVPAPSATEGLVARLAPGIIARSLRGAADYLREEAMARSMGVGRTAIRQAFARLAGRGLIVHVPRCGWRVRPFDEGDLEAYLAVRETLELKALALARPNLDSADLRRMRAGNRPRGQPPRLDNSLHAYLVERAGNPYIRDFFERHAAYFTTLLDFAAPETHVVAAMARQHRVILAALIDEDWPRARRELVRHIRAQRPIVKDLLARLGRPPAPNPEGTPP